MKDSSIDGSDRVPPATALAELCELWAWTIPIALLGSWTCFARLPGVNWSLWTICAAGAFIVVGRRSDRPGDGIHRRGALALACLLSGAAAVTANRPSTDLIFLSVAALFSFCILSTAIRTRDIGPSALVRAPLTVCRLVLAEAQSRVAETLERIRMREAVPVIRGCTLAAALMAALLLLLSAADPTLAGWRDAAWTAIVTWTFVARDAFCVLLATFLLGAFGLAARGPGAEANGTATAPSVLPASSSRTRFGDVERLIVIATALAPYLLFFALELWNRLDSHGIRPSGGETPAQATHRGFAEMIAAAALCAVVLIALDHRARRGDRERLVRAASWGVIAASLIVVASAYERVRFYEAMYGYTEQRLYVQVCCAAVAAALLLLAWELRSPIDLARLTRHIALIAILCVGSLSYWNSGAWIVRANVRRREQTGKLDVIYLERLARHSRDAIPALVETLPGLPPAQAQQLRSTLNRLRLGRWIPEPPGRRFEAAWYEWNLRRAAARSALRAAGLSNEAPVASKGAGPYDARRY
jgi:Domain of unknown function (DUF4153)